MKRGPRHAARIQMKTYNCFARLAITKKERETR